MTLSQTILWLARYSKDHAQRSISIGPAIPASSPNENANRTPANNGTVTGAGDEFAYVPETGPGFEYPVNVAWDVSVSGGTLSALVVALELSDDGLNWTSVDTNNSVTGGRKVVSNTVPRFMRANITTFTQATGTPVVLVGITC